MPPELDAGVGHVAHPAGRRRAWRSVRLCHRRLADGTDRRAWQTEGMAKTVTLTSGGRLRRWPG
jgi:hypothetical protein